MDGALDTLEATVLFQVLDETLGVFRSPVMTEEEWKYWALARERFIKTYSSKIPPYFWFRGVSLDSCSLSWRGDTPQVVATPKCPGEEAALEEANRLLAGLELHSFTPGVALSGEPLQEES